MKFLASWKESSRTPPSKNVESSPPTIRSLRRANEIDRRHPPLAVQRSIVWCGVIALLLVILGFHGANDVQAEEVDPTTPASTTSLKINRYKKKADLKYCDNEGDAGLCDLFLPQAEKSENDAANDSLDNAPTPVILLVHGGGWMSGSKWTMNRHASKLAVKGYACLTINYRHAPKHQFPAQVDDLRSALVWIHDHADTYGFDVNRIGLFGYSAGGHLVSLVATLADEPWQRVARTTQWEKDDPRWTRMPTIKAVCSGGTPTEFGYLSEDSRALAFLFGGTPAEKPETYLAAAPLEHVSPSDPAFELLHGKEDKLVLPSGTESFHSALKQAGVNASMTLLPRCGHFLAFISPKMTSTMMSFFDNQLLAKEESN